MNIRPWTLGNQVSKNGNQTVYQGTTTTEGLAIGQKVSDSVLTGVEIGDKIVISDLDDNKSLQVGIQEMAVGHDLQITNKDGEFETTTSFPVEVDADQVARGADMAGGFDVNKVTISEGPNGAIFISLADPSGMGERGFAIADGKVQAFLRGA